MCVCETVREDLSLLNCFYRGDLCAIDWKTSLKPKKKISDLYEYPLQLVAYAGAINVDENYLFKVGSYC